MLNKKEIPSFAEEIEAFNNFLMDVFNKG